MLIEFSKFNIKLLVILIFPVFRTIERFITISYITKDNSIFDAFRYFLSHLFAIFLLMIYHKKNKKRKSSINPSQLIEGDDVNFKTLSDENVTSLIEIMEKENKKNRKTKSIIFLIGLSLNGLFCFLYRTIFNYQVQDFEFERQSMLIFFDIGLFILLSYIILKQRLYKHHILSMILMGFVLFILFIITIKYILIGKNFLFSAIYFFFYSFSFGLYDVLIKKYMNDYYKNPYFITFYTGIIDTILLLIFEIFAYFLNRDISGIIIGFQNNINSVINVFEYILTLIFEFLWVLGIKLTIYYFTPCHHIISEYISEYIYYIKNVINSDKEFYSASNAIIFTIAYLINFFCCLVFNEVIILNFWKLDYNTKKRIRERMITADFPDDDESFTNQTTNENEDLTIN